jgi:23S rRNA (uracil1939-C5)-methyltransferase
VSSNKRYLRYHLLTTHYLLRPLYMPCPQKDRCGSCGWSHIPYEKQLAQKLSDINGSFAIKKLDLHVSEVLPSPKTDHYRNRMDFVIDFQGNVGLREKGKWWRVIDDHPCFIADEKIEELFRAVRAWTKTAGLSFYDRKAHTGILRYAVIRATSIGETMINIVTSAPEIETSVANATTVPKATPRSRRHSKSHNTHLEYQSHHHRYLSGR